MTISNNSPLGWLAGINTHGNGPYGKEMKAKESGKETVYLLFYFLSARAK